MTLGVNKKSPPVTREDLEFEKLRREQARRHYRFFRNYVDPKFENGPHNLLLAAALEEIELFIRTRGKEGNNRLIAEMPPQYGKTTDIARMFPGYVLGRNPNTHVGIVSYGADLADKHSAAVRDLVRSDLYNNLFGGRSVLEDPLMVSDGSSSRSDWSLAKPHSGGCISRGTGGGLSGNPIDLLIIDDPTKDVEEARSAAHQSKLENWFDSVAIPRMSEWGAIIIVHTRWDPNDLIGQQLKKMAGGDPRATKWKIIYLPALALEKDQYPKNEAEFKENLLRGYFIPMGGDQLGRQPGETLWPWRYSRDYVLGVQANMDPFIFAALHQQLPRSFTGGFFDQDDIQIIEASVVPPDLTWCAYVDLALGNTGQSDRNAVMPQTIDPNTGMQIGRDLIYERDLNRFLYLLKKAMLDPWNKKVIWGIEGTAFQTLVFEKFRKDPELAMVAILKIIPQESKEDRASMVSLAGKQGLLGFVRAPWNVMAVREMLEFPHGKHDDIVDTVSGGRLMIAKHAKKTESKIW